MATLAYIGLLAGSFVTLAIGTPVLAEPVSKTVEYGDLDLTSQVGQQRLETRIKSAVRAVCGQSYATTFAERRLVEKCKSPAMAAAMRDANVAIAQAKDGKLLASNQMAVVGN